MGLTLLVKPLGSLGRGGIKQGVASSDFHCLKNRPAAEWRKDGRMTPVHTEQNAGVVQALWVEVGAADMETSGWARGGVRWERWHHLVSVNTEAEGKKDIEDDPSVWPDF